MSPSISTSTRYDLGFTGATLRLDQFLVVARCRANGDERDLALELGNGKRSTGKRMLGEFDKRLDTLTAKELDLLVHGELSSQKQLALLAVCKAYDLIRDFIVEVVREKALVYDMKLSDGEYLSFYRRKTELHPELEAVTTITQNKFRQVVFKILEQAGLVDSVRSKVIQRQLLDPRVVRAVIADDPEWLKLYLLSDQEISSNMNGA